ncbi:MAG: hypothetical protein LBQ28_00730 [Prevotellaceae bacterium]|jgi:hypothetical protein|nr:hypothetical protein [Prevotellaceae bacterium]
MHKIKNFRITINPAKGQDINNRRCSDSERQSLNEVKPTDKSKPLPVVRDAGYLLKNRQCSARKQRTCCFLRLRYASPTVINVSPLPVLKKYLSVF